VVVVDALGGDLGNLKFGQGGHFACPSCLSGTEAPYYLE